MRRPIEAHSDAEHERSNANTFNRRAADQRLGCTCKKSQTESRGNQIPDVSSRKICEDYRPPDWREKLFAELLQSVRLRGSIYFRPEMRGPWGFSIANHGSIFHTVAAGKCSTATGLNRGEN